MFAWWGRTVVRARWLVFVASIAVAILGGLWGTGVFGALSNGGFDTPGSESSRAAERIVAEVGRQDVDVLALYSSATSTVDDPVFRDAVTGVVAGLHGRSEVVRAVSYYDTHSPAFTSTDRHATYVAIRLANAGSASQLDAIRPALDAAGLRVQVGGISAINGAITNRVSEDIGRAEAYSMPILLILLIFVFRSVVAATTPLLVGGLAIMGAFTATRVLTYSTEVSIFAINIITLIGLGMAVDYALFIVSRFREELDAGRSTPEAIERTMATAGRTVAVSGLTVAVALSSLLLFPQVFLRSMGYGGMAAILVAMLAAVTTLPALLALLGHRVNAWRVPFPRRRGASGDAWARIARWVMRRPVLVVVGTLAVLAVLASPFVRAGFGGIDERVLPAGTESRVVAERLAADFPRGAGEIVVLVSGADPATAQAFANDVAALPHVRGATVTANRDRSSVISVGYDGDPTAPAVRGTVAAIRALPAPAGAQVLVGGQAGALTDLLNSLGARLPWMALLVAGTTILLLFLAFGSVVLPFKAILMNAVSIGASFGAVVWAFQDGHLAGLLGFTSTGYVEATQLILMLAILFGLSTDYEVFLLSRVREEWVLGGDSRGSVVRGLTSTARVISAAAAIMVSVFCAFTLSDDVIVKMMGLGLAVAVFLDATLIRLVLVPATMSLLGDLNWWMPRWLDRWLPHVDVGAAVPVTPAEPVPGPSLTRVS
jgi:uncharacterized membrane protein YdfJ with MMPL/SSD domain